MSKDAPLPRRRDPAKILFKEEPSLASKKAAATRAKRLGGYLMEYGYKGGWQPYTYGGNSPPVVFATRGEAERAARELKDEYPRIPTRIVRERS